MKGVYRAVRTISSNSSHFVLKGFKTTAVCSVSHCVVLYRHVRWSYEF